MDNQKSLLRGKLSPRTLELLEAYVELWGEVFDAIYADLADPDTCMIDVDAIAITSAIVPCVASDAVTFCRRMVQKSEAVRK